MGLPDFMEMYRSVSQGDPGHQTDRPDQEAHLRFQTSKIEWAVPYISRGLPDINHRMFGIRRCA